MKEEGLNLAKAIVAYLRSNLKKYGLVKSEENYYNESLWHARITGCFAAAGAKKKYLIETARRLTQREDEDKKFLEDYRKQYRKASLGDWSKFGPKSYTEIDTIFIDQNTHLVKALCEYENSFVNAVHDNIIKFCALAKCKKKHQPILCVIGFWSGKKGEESWENNKQNVYKKIKSEKSWKPLWLFIPFFREEKRVYWKYSLVNSNGKEIDSGKKNFLKKIPKG